jgi:hypothetical protein
MEEDTIVESKPYSIWLVGRNWMIITVLVMIFIPFSWCTIASAILIAITQTVFVPCKSILLSIGITVTALFFTDLVTFLLKLVAS